MRVLTAVEQYNVLCDKIIYRDDRNKRLIELNKVSTVKKFLR